MTDTMQAEFDTVATWTADVAVDFGPEYFIPAACRGSGSPATLRWLLDGLAVSSTDTMLDCGAGVGGPAAFATETTGVTTVLTDLKAGACRAARRLFALPVVQAASDLPFRSESFDVAWSLGVLCTVQDQLGVLSELHRVLSSAGRLGLLVFVSDGGQSRKTPAGNDFPSWSRLLWLLSTAGFTIDAAVTEADMSSAPADWQQRADAVDAELDRRHHDDDRWRDARRQSEEIGDLLTRRMVNATALVASRAD